MIGGIEIPPSGSPFVITRFVMPNGDLTLTFMKDSYIIFRFEFLLFADVFWWFSHSNDLENETKRILHECLCFIESIKRVKGKEINCEACRAFYPFFATSLINSIIQEHEC